MDRFFRWLLAAALPYRRAVFRAGGFLLRFDDFHRWYSEGELRQASLDAERALIDVREHDLRVIVLDDPRYPPLLRLIFDPPPVLFCTGDLPAVSWSGIVGTRRPSFVTLAAARFLVRRAPAGRGIVSGFARGVDFEAHREAMNCGLPTAAVLGSGVLRPTPDASLALLRRAESEGKNLVLVSEFLPSTPALKYHFPRRNRIIAGMADEILLLQAPARSGGLITARYALEEGRGLFVFDHPLLSASQNEGGRRLLGEGAEYLEVEELLARIVQKPPPALVPGPAQLEFFRKKRSGLRWVRDDYYIEE